MLTQNEQGALVLLVTFLLNVFWIVVYCLWPSNSELTRRIQGRIFVFMFIISLIGITIGLSFIKHP